jgi:hypothetical protein
MMMALGPMEILILMALGGGAQTADLAALLPADMYFQSRRIAISADSMIEIASKKPEDGKTQIAQLLALRILAEQPELAKKAQNPAQFIGALQRIAKGTLAKDRLGFSEEYAARTLAALGEARIGGELMKQRNMREDTLGWFPASATVVAAFDARDRTAGTEEGKILRQLTAKFTKEKDWEKVFEVAEMLGNVRIERIGIAFVEDKQAKEKERMFLRIGGKADHSRMVAAIKKLSSEVPGGLSVQETKDADGTPIATLRPAKDMPVVALIGDTDFVIAGFPFIASGRRVNGAADPAEADALKQLLAIRAGKEPSVIKGNGVLKEALGKLSPKASGLIAGELSEEMRKQLFGPVGGPVPPPHAFRAELVNVKEGLDLRAHLTMANADDATRMTQAIVMGQKHALDDLQKMPANAPIPASTVAALKKAIESVQAQAKGNAVEIGMFLPNEALRSLPTIALFRAAQELQPAQPPPGKLKEREPPPPVKDARLPAQRWLTPLTMPAALVACLHGKT